MSGKESIQLSTTEGLLPKSVRVTLGALYIKQALLEEGALLAIVNPKVGERPITSDWGWRPATERAAGTW